MESLHLVLVEHSISSGHLVHSHGSTALPKSATGRLAYHERGEVFERCENWGLRTKKQELLAPVSSKVVLPDVAFTFLIAQIPQGFPVSSSSEVYRLAPKAGPPLKA